MIINGPNRNRNGLKRYNNLQPNKNIKPTTTNLVRRAIFTILLFILKYAVTQTCGIQLSVQIKKNLYNNISDSP